jgi:hypothetical protein
MIKKTRGRPALKDEIGVSVYREKNLQFRIYSGLKIFGSDCVDLHIGSGEDEGFLLLTKGDTRKLTFVGAAGAVKALCTTADKVGIDPNLVRQTKACRLPITERPDGSMLIDCRSVSAHHNSSIAA